MKHRDNPHSPGLWLNQPGNEDELERVKQENFERDQLHKLVRDELNKYGVLLQRTVVAKSLGFRTKMNTFTLFGQLQANVRNSRPVLYEGDFRTCCQVAACELDKLDAAQELGT